MENKTSTLYITYLQILFKIIFVILIFISGAFISTVTTDGYYISETEKEYSHSIFDVATENVDKSRRDYFSNWEENRYDYVRSRDTEIETAGHRVIGGDFKEIQAILLILLGLFVLADIFFTVTRLTKSEKLKRRGWHIILPIGTLATLLIFGLIIAMAEPEVIKYIYYAHNIEPDMVQFIPDGTVIAQRIQTFAAGPVFYIAVVLGLVIIALDLYIMACSKKKNDNYRYTKTVMQ